MDSVERQRILAARLLPFVASHLQIVRFDAGTKSWVARAAPGAGDMFKSVYDPRLLEVDGTRVEYKTDDLDLGEI